MAKVKTFTEWASAWLGHSARTKNCHSVQIWRSIRRSKSCYGLDQHTNQVHKTVEGLLWHNVLRFSTSAGATGVEGFTSTMLNLKNGNSKKNHETFAKYYKKEKLCE